MTHPAPYTDALLPYLAGMLPTGPIRVLDPFAGTGKVVLLRQWRPEAEFWGYEIEDEWAAMARAAGCICTTGDSRHLHFPPAFFQACCFSPTYGSRMADHHNARDNSPRHTYRHELGRPLTPGNSGAMQWSTILEAYFNRKLHNRRIQDRYRTAGNEYRALHVAVYRQLRRVLQPGGILVINLKDHIRKGQLQPVTNWHTVTLLQLGFVCTARQRVACPGQRHGANGQLRVPFESVFRFELRRS